MKKTLLIILSIVSLVACDNDSSEKENATTDLEIFVDGTFYKNTSFQSGANENCGFINLNMYSLGADDFIFDMQMTFLKNGELLKLYLTQITEDGTRVSFHPPYLNESAIRIENFVYDEAKEIVSFDFGGKLYNPLDNTLIKTISGTLKYPNLGSDECVPQFVPQITYDTDEFKFIANRVMQNKPTASSYSFDFYSTSESRITINLDENVWDLPLKAYSFDQSSTANYVQFATYSNSIATTNQEERWFSYDTEGEIVIEEKVIEGGRDKLRGTITMKIFNNTSLEYTIERMDFNIWKDSE
ncbi:hypothetical protein Celal_4046 [Cellulophaga algicola DSM 14237]|uniref:Lipoprotein n=1 Tax=Cellulophaga algicola (strain DSM 14237 / IC166 / ACAM 630) TaxID=688270 RepID=E6XDV1_CELAD|nr:hypothetical protein [Cellulophaga algicola]ADV51289.1 hypothetical protein Celal_4046 [Cellulophaga algicola DSM 14237]